MSLDIHNFTRKLEMRLERLDRETKAGEISERNRKIMLDFKQHCDDTNLKNIRILKYLSELSQLAKKLNKDFDKVTVKDIQKLKNDIMNNIDYSVWTKHDYMVCLKKFYSWLLGEEKNNETKKKRELRRYIAELKTHIKKTDKPKPKKANLITEKEVKKLINVAKNLRDKAMIAVLYETGARASELLSMNISDVVTDESGDVSIHVDGKTGERAPYIDGAIPHLMAWLEQHPDKDNPAAPLWCGLEQEYIKKRISYQRLRTILKDLAKKGKIEPTAKVRPHAFRHAIATEYSKWLPESVLCQYFGWEQGSDMPAVYVHLSGRDTKDAFQQMKGKKDIVVSKPFYSSTCKFCGTKNDSDARFCKNCAKALSISETITADEKTKALVDYVSKMAELKGIDKKLNEHVLTELGFEKFLQ